MREILFVIIMMIYGGVIFEFQIYLWGEELAVFAGDLLF